MQISIATFIQLLQMGRIFLHGDNRLCPALSWQGIYKGFSFTALLYQTLYFGLNETENSN